MPPAQDKTPLTTTHIIIIVVVAVIGIVLIGSAISFCLNRRKRQHKNVRYMNPKLRGGADDEAEVVEFMKSGSFDSTHLKTCELDSSRPPCELGYSTRPLSEVPRTLQPGQSNTALPGFSPLVVNVPTLELEDTSRRELPPATSDQVLKPIPLNFSRPARDNKALTCDTKGFEQTTNPRSTATPEDDDVKPADPKRVSSPTIPKRLQSVNKDESWRQRQSSPVSPLASPDSSPRLGRKRRVSFASPVSPFEPSSSLDEGSRLALPERPATG
ncbi:hypothetical protein CERZMDRAFT_96842 [Cercospora zeae-maydis SCOH1-5]|uniref:Uncharacterized protein n=1 Tax=Cercospora zeae-maydis SCOH1-5 TaxID=717836 RepID=A0A6A6FIS9_9PEZI|nr:hypothetical protein CERZMDRAFT_96842 [Cercospora zeae-maydis SCOH1-5]